MKAFIVDLAKCNGCRNCQISCKDEHVDNDWTPYAKPQPDTGQFWVKVDERTCGQVPHVQVNFLPHLCNHCANPACAQACPEDAFSVRDDGIVLLEPEKCTGCFARVDACPYDAIFPNEELGIAQKCTGCAHLLDDGWTVPRCVDACCTGALRFGDEEDFEDEIAQATTLKPESNCGPRVYYLNDPKRFVAGTIVDFEADEVVIGAEVELLDGEGRTVATGKTDWFGNFWFRKVEPAAYTVLVKADGCFERRVAVDVTAEDKSLGAVGVSKER